MPDSLLPLPDEPQDLIGFVEARLADDERVARAAGWHRWTLGIVYGTVMAFSNAKIVARDCREYDAEHLARHDPARVLREVEAKRRLLAAHDIQREPSDFEGRKYVVIWCATCGEPGFCLSVKLLAAPYADHADFRPEWSPDAH